MPENYYEKFMQKKGGKASKSAKKADKGNSQEFVKNGKNSAKFEQNSSNFVEFSSKNEKKSQKIDKFDKKLDFEKSSKNSKNHIKNTNNHKSNINNHTNSYKIINSLFEPKSLPKDALPVLENFDQIIQGIRPLNSKQLQQLPDNIRQLSHQLTDQRAERRLGYMNESVQLSSYVRYYTWWNLVRLTRLFANLPEECFPIASGTANGTPTTDETPPATATATTARQTSPASTAASKFAQICLDLGSGPLTVVTALWLARPQLRKLPLTWYCLDVSANSMAMGEDIFLSVTAKTGGEPWKIIRVKGSFGTAIKQKADFVTSANMFNELDQSTDLPPEAKAKKYYQQLKNYANPNAKFLLIEPGVPKASRTLGLLRSRFIADGKSILAPCPHAQDCPMNGFKAFTGSQNKWCNFAFSTEDAPTKLQKLSERAKLPKERATLAFVAAFTQAEPQVASQASTTQTKPAIAHDTAAASPNQAPGFPHHANANAPHTEASTSHAASVQANSPLLCRIASDPIRLPAYKTGFYACSRLGLTLLRMPQVPTNEDGTFGKTPVTSGDLLEIQLNSSKTKRPDPSLQKDEKSGALIIDL